MQMGARSWVERVGQGREKPHDLPSDKKRQVAQRKIGTPKTRFLGFFLDSPLLPTQTQVSTSSPEETGRKGRLQENPRSGQGKTEVGQELVTTYTCYISQRRSLGTSLPHSPFQVLLLSAWRDHSQSKSGLRTSLIFPSGLVL